MKKFFIILVLLFFKVLGFGETCIKVLNCDGCNSDYPAKSGSSAIKIQNDSGSTSFTQDYTSPYGYVLMCQNDGYHREFSVYHNTKNSTQDEYWGYDIIDINYGVIDFKRNMPYISDISISADGGSYSSSTPTFDYKPSKITIKVIIKKPSDYKYSDSAYELNLKVKSPSGNEILSETKSGSYLSSSKTLYFYLYSSDLSENGNYIKVVPKLNIKYASWSGYNLTDTWESSTLFTINSNTKPTIEAKSGYPSAYSTVKLKVGELERVKVIVKDEDGNLDKVTYSPSNLVSDDYDGASGYESTESSDLKCSEVGNFTVTATVYDEKNEKDSIKWYLNCEKANSEPSITINTNISTNRNQPLTDNFTISDSDNDSVTTTIKSNPSNGTLSLNSNSYTYIPDNNYNGSDSFTLKFDDGNGGIVEKIISVNVNNYNQLPSVTIDESVSVDEDSQITKNFSVSDADGDTVTTTVKTNPTNGTLTLNSNSYTYKPNANFNGNDSFILKFDDGYSNYGVVEKSILITVNNINDKPTFSGTQNISVDEDSQITNTITIDDIDGDSVNVTIKSNPYHGNLNLSKLSKNKYSYTYTPNSNYNGSDSFTLKLNDGNGGVVEKSFNVSISSINDKPTLSINANDKEGKAPFSINFSANGEDVDDSYLSYYWDFKDGSTSTEKNPSHTFENSGTYNVSCKVSDSSGESTTENVTVTITEANTPTVNFDYSIDKKTVTFQDNTSNSDGLIETYYWDFGDGDSSTEVNPTKTYLECNKEYEVKLTVTNSYNKSSFAQKSIETSCIKPTLNISASPTNGKTPLEVEFSAKSQNQIESYYWDFGDGDTSTEANPTHTFTTSGEYLVNCEIVDKNGISEAKNLTIKTVENKKPTIEDISKEVALDKKISIELVGNDEDGEDLTYEIVNEPTKGEVSINGNILVYEAKEAGVDNFSYKAFDGIDYSNEATIKINVQEKIDTLSVSKSKLYVYKDIDKNSTTIEVFGGKAPYSWTSKEGEIKYLNDDKSIAYYILPIVKTDDTITIKSQDGETLNVNVIYIDKLDVSPKKAYFNNFDGNLEIKIYGGIKPYNAIATAGDVKVNEDLAIYQPANRFQKQQITIKDASNQEAIVEIFVEGGLQITPSNPTLDLKESIKLKVISGSGNYSWSVEKGTLSNFDGDSVTYTAPNLDIIDKVTVSDDSGETSIAIINVGENSNPNINLTSGWNLVSIPINVGLATIDNDSIPPIGYENIDILGDFEVIWIFKNNKWYSNKDSNFKIESKKGFWIKTNTSRVVNFEGETYTPSLVDLANGWSLLGTGEKINNITSLFNFETVWLYKNGSWSENPTLIDSGDGFWVKK